LPQQWSGEKKKWQQKTFSQPEPEPKGKNYFSSLAAARASAFVLNGKL
jgi:hypothetical protein